MAVVLEFDESTANAVTSALGSTSTILHDASQVVASLAATTDPLVIIGPSVDTGVAIRVTTAVIEAQPIVGVIWLRRRVDTSIVLEAIRAGASDVVGESDLPALVAAAERVLGRANTVATASGDPTAAGATTRGTVTAVFASKGGCGKSSIATNLACLLSSEARTRVCVLDLDLESGDVALLMSLARGRSILDLASLGGSVDAGSLAACMSAHPSGVYVLPAPRRPEEAAAVSPALVSRVVELATSMFDHVIIDCPPYATEHVLSVLDVADHLALVCTPDAASVKNTAIALEMFEELNFKGQISLMINHAGDKVGITTSDISDALNQPVACEIPSSLDLPLAT
ncbi:MAG: P-loop NTPase, partial [Actinobacteria bacterium]|nr:P-loop NTPase [Actinomycetota bacterium]